jgi:Spy/CpxP family protein refolding chaperone
MQKFNVLVLASLSLALAAPLVPAFAQAPPPPMHGPMGGPMHGPMGGPMHGGYGGGGGGRMKKMAGELGLTDAQKSKMMAMMTASRQQAEAVRNNTKLTPAARMAKMQALQASNRSKMMAIMTPAQRTKMQAMMQARRGGRPGG